MQCRRPGFAPWVGRIPWRREWLLTPGFLPGKSQGQRSRVGYMLSTGPLRVGHNLATNQEQWEFSHRLPNKELLYLTNRCDLRTESQLWEFFIQ